MWVLEVTTETSAALVNTPPPRPANLIGSGIHEHCGFYGVFQSKNWAGRVGDTSLLPEKLFRFFLIAHDFS